MHMCIPLKYSEFFVELSVVIIYVRLLHILNPTAFIIIYIKNTVSSVNSDNLFSIIIIGNLGRN